jgi:hypothetical protein
MKLFLPVLAASIALTSPRADAAFSEDEVTSNGKFEILAPYLFSLDGGVWSPLLHGPPFPLDAYLREHQGFSLGHFHVVQPPWDPTTDAGWLYANDTGRVRVIADNFNFHTPEGFGAFGERGYTRWLTAVLHWRKKYTYRAGDTARFTVNKSYLSVKHPHWYETLPPGEVPPTPKDLPHAKQELLIRLHRPELNPGAECRVAACKVTDEFWSEIHLVRDSEVFRPCFSFPACEPWDPDTVCVIATSDFSSPMHDIRRCEWGLDRGALSSNPGSPLAAYPIDQGDDYVLIQTDPYPGTIDLSALNEGEGYVIEYILIADVASYGSIENATSVLVGDPLDPGSGLHLEVTSPPAPGKAPRLCEVETDEARFADHADGTTTDTYTGLMWQRCPGGFSLDDAGTPGNPRDDRCPSTSSVIPTWQGALQHAAADATAGHADWRLPNVKELESIVELGCLAPAIEPGPFPDTPSEVFWTSTPGRDGAQAMAVSFFDGQIAPADKNSPARLRLVRGSALAPVAALPGLRVGRPAPVLEPDAVTASMAFTVVLDRAVTSDVNASYHTLDDGARAGEDYVATSGTLVIPAGARTAQVAVPILPDGAGEPPETLYLVLDQVSPNARLAVAASSGTILDSQPRVELAEANVQEGDTGNARLAFLVTLGRASSADTTVSYAASDGTATSGDYLPVAGTVTIPAGQTSAWAYGFTIGDTAVEGDEYLVLTLTGVSANAALGSNASARGYIVEDDLPVAQALNDTGIGQCTNGSIFTSCPQAGWTGQDAESGRDVTHDVSEDGYRGFSFTKLDAAGVPLADQTQPYATAPWSCVRDEVTALVWEVKTDDGGLHDKDWTYTWYSSTGIDDGGSPGTPGGGVCAGSGCDTESLVAAVNAAGWCGAADWRLPGREEVRSLVVAKDGGFLYLGDPPFFPNAPGSHWTSTPGIDPARARYFVGSIPTEGPKSTSQAVRLVRGGI